MISETRKSINSILYERISSPFFGTLIISWLLWNWKIVYTTFILSSEDIGENKIDYIVCNFNDSNYLIWLPLASTIILLTVIPFLSNGAYWLNLKFDKWKINKKNEIEKKQLLTLEQSIQLREQILNMEKQFDSLLTDKNDEIKQLEILISESKEEGNTKKTNSTKKSLTTQSIIKADFLKDKILKNDELNNALPIISRYVQSGVRGLSSHSQMTSDIILFYESNRIIENNGNGVYKWTELGKEVNKLLMNDKF